MSGRNRGPPLPMKGAIHGVLPPAPAHVGLGGGGGIGPVPPPQPPHPALLEELRIDPRRLPPRHPAVIEDRLAVQYQEIQGLLADNQRLAATHVALKQELEVAQQELQYKAHFAASLQVEKDGQMRELHDKFLRLEADLRGVEAMRTELRHVRADVKDLSDVRQELTGQIQAMNQDLARYNADLQQLPALKAQIESMKLELQRARGAIEYEKKGYADNYEHGQRMQNKLIAMAREVEKLRAEIASADKRPPSVVAAAAAAAQVNLGTTYNANYGNPEAGYPVYPYQAGYGMNPVQAHAESFPHYGAGSGTWVVHDMQRAQGHR